MGMTRYRLQWFSDNLILDPVQNTVDETSGVLRSIPFPEVNGFVNGNFWRNLSTVEEFEEGHTEDISFDNIDTV